MIEVNPRNDISFGRKANEDREERNNQAKPDQYIQEGAHVVLGNSSASHGESTGKHVIHEPTTVYT